jgi:SET domain-containing protein|tara:strand:- start:2001 stop:2315 length:315 start_codon:yes stop_codon:yes gene_type:complete
VSQNYKPLPDSLTIRESDIQGLGLFAVEKIPAGRFLGIGWIKAELAQNGAWRTPLGGFINHSDTPNCVKMHKDDPTSEYIFLNVGDKDIEAGEELTVKYTLYSV